jgi:hypothetical protein
MREVLFSDSLGNDADSPLVPAAYRHFGDQDFRFTAEALTLDADDGIDQSLGELLSFSRREHTLEESCLDEWHPCLLPRSITDLRRMIRLDGDRRNWQQGETDSAKEKYPAAVRILVADPRPVRRDPTTASAMCMEGCGPRCGSGGVEIGQRKGTKVLHVRAW